MNGKGKDRALACVVWVSSVSFNGMPFLPSLDGRGGGKISLLQYAGDLSAGNEAESSGNG